jgi:hypothetical protein
MQVVTFCNKRRELISKRNEIMALIKCYECDKEMSDKAKACPHCGAPHENQAENFANKMAALRELKMKMMDHQRRHSAFYKRTSSMSNPYSDLGVNAERKMLTMEYENQMRQFKMLTGRDFISGPDCWGMRNFGLI